MNITILGAGNMGSALAKQLARAGHQVRITSRDAAKARAVAGAVPGAAAVAAKEALAGSDVVVVATGYVEAVPALRSLGSLAGKIVIYITNPVTPDYMGLTIGFSSSAAEEIAKAVPADAPDARRPFAQLRQPRTHDPGASANVGAPCETNRAGRRRHDHYAL
jgi:8-hydroxy-5-deazaflavin:NADPH oxidoreductase